MTDAGFFRGTNSEQDTRFSDKQKKLMKTMKFSDVLQEKVDIKKVRLETVKPWIAQRITELLGLDDEVVVEYVFTQLEADVVDPKQMQINLTGFLNGKNAREFMRELWETLISAQNNPTGIPDKLIEAKKQEMKDREVEQDKVNAAIRKTTMHIDSMNAPSKEALNIANAAAANRTDDRKSPYRQQRRSPGRRVRSPQRTFRRSPSRSPRRRRTPSPRRSDYSRDRRSPPRRNRSRTPDRAPAETPAKVRDPSPRGKAEVKKKKSSSRSSSRSSSVPNRRLLPAIKGGSPGRPSSKSASPEPANALKSDRKESPPPRTAIKKEESPEPSPKAKPKNFRTRGESSSRSPSPKRARGNRSPSPVPAKNRSPVVKRKSPSPRRSKKLSPGRRSRSASRSPGRMRAGRLERPTSPIRVNNPTRGEKMEATDNKGRPIQVNVIRNPDLDRFDDPEDARRRARLNASVRNRDRSPLRRGGPGGPGLKSFSPSPRRRNYSPSPRKRSPSPRGMRPKPRSPSPRRDRPLPPRNRSPSPDRRARDAGRAPLPSAPREPPAKLSRPDAEPPVAKPKPAEARVEPIRTRDRSASPQPEPKLGKPSRDAPRERERSPSPPRRGGWVEVGAKGDKKADSGTRSVDQEKGKASNTRAPSPPARGKWAEVGPAKPDYMRSESDTGKKKDTKDSERESSRSALKKEVVPEGWRSVSPEESKRRREEKEANLGTKTAQKNGSGDDEGAGNGEKKDKKRKHKKEKKEKKEKKDKKHKKHKKDKKSRKESPQPDTEDIEARLRAKALAKLKPEAK